MGTKWNSIACLAGAGRGGLYTSMLHAGRVEGEREGGTESEEILLDRFYVCDSERGGDSTATR